MTVTSNVTMTLTGAALGDDPSGTSTSRPNMIGMRVTGISMITVPHTVGVRTRRSSDNLADRPNWNRAERVTRVASSPGPPSTRAVTQTAMNAAEVPMSSTWPEPTRPTRTAWRIVVIPLMASAANAAHERKSSPAPAARTTMAGVRTIPATESIAN